jgi:hypothetical protein
MSDLQERKTAFFAAKIAETMAAAQKAKVIQDAADFETYITSRNVGELESLCRQLNHIPINIYYPSDGSHRGGGRVNWLATYRARLDYIKAMNHHQIGEIK